jgi:hypothetical protein
MKTNQLIKNPKGAVIAAVVTFGDDAVFGNPVPMLDLETQTFLVSELGTCVCHVVNILNGGVDEDGPVTDIRIAEDVNILLYPEKVTPWDRLQALMLQAKVKFNTLEPTAEQVATLVEEPSADWFGDELLEACY